MNNLERLELIDRVARELQSRMTYSDIDVYLRTHGVDRKQPTSGVNSKWVYSKELLAGEPAEKVLRIATELGVTHGFVVDQDGSPIESSFWEPGYFRVFLSHLSSFKKQTAALQRALRAYGVSAFVAHVDIEPSREWMREIEAALMSMDAMVAIVMPGFQESRWTDQEVGFAIGRGKLVIPVLREMDPYGFLGKFQGFRAEGKTVGQVARGIFLILGTNERTRGKMVSTLIALAGGAVDEPEAQSRIQSLTELRLTAPETARLGDSVAANPLFFRSRVLQAAVNALLQTHALPLLHEERKAHAEEKDDLPF